MSDATPPAEWLEAANHSATVTAQLSSVIHGLNNILQGISGNAEMMEMTPGVPPPVLKRAETIGAEAMRASAMLSEVLTLFRDAPATVHTVDMFDVATRALSLRRYLLTKAGIDAELEPAEGQFMATANRRRALQIALNLIANAQHALTGRDGARVRLKVTRDGDRIVLAVEDNAGGIAVDAVSLQRFPSPDAASSGPVRLGIGLGVASWLAEQQGGTLEVRTLPDNSGSVASLALPSA